ncbi:hypothetical protein [Evansella cellulosilytica]|uniref:Uncharacterized protein n=1 Tax=Evansella cellulosilytica (strain ATCC 21833 / DSM 2522 / FERM P-1141 / JCM 9156 / N-4) TaxID=649639 RepID=E6TVG6_EVAC2|nr:hypothetical protein [Evansella cellulosilytica]ADU30983.1 hypothetical protein Bcell_2728 [Evansella cellulosilytica DSM 2522]
MKYRRKVKKLFKDKYDPKKYHKKDSVFESEDPERIEDLQNRDLISEEEYEPEQQDNKSVLDQNASDVVAAINSDLSKEELQALFTKESEGKNRSTVLKHIESLVKGEGNEPGAS